MNFLDNKENTYYLKEIPGLVKQNDFLEKEYNNQTGFLGRKLIENPWLSDNAKLNLIETAKPQYKKQINFIKSSLPYIKKGQNINKKYFSGRDINLKDQYQLHLNNMGGKKRKSKKTRKIRKEKKSNKLKKTRRMTY
jgi:hypothetical protein